MTPRPSRPAVVAALLLACSLARADTEPKRLHLEPTNEPSETLVVWMTEDDTDSEVEWGTSEGNLDRRESNDDAERYSKGSYRSDYIHTVTLDGLPAETRIYYRVGDGDEWSDVRSFTTRPNRPSRTTRVVVFGDQETGDDPKRVMDQVLDEDKDIDFIWHLGDISYADGKQREWDEHADDMEKGFSRIPVMSIVGNHDEEDGDFDAYLARWRHPSRGEEEFWWSIDSGPVHFFSLSCEHDFKERRDQYKWLEEDLERATDPEQRKRVPWIVGAIHKPDYSSGKHGENDSIMKELDRIAREYKVNLMFAGHDHNYERTYPVYDGERTSRERGSLSDPYIVPEPFDATDDRLDTIRLVVGTGGKSIRDCKRRKDYSLTGCIERHGFGMLEADRGSLTFTFKDKDGDTRDAFKMCTMRDCDDPPPLDDESSEEDVPRSEDSAGGDTRGGTLSSDSQRVDDGFFFPDLWVTSNPAPGFLPATPEAPSSDAPEPGRISAIAQTMVRATPSPTPAPTAAPTPAPFVYPSFPDRAPRPPPATAGTRSGPTAAESPPFNTALQAPPFNTVVDETLSAFFDGQLLNNDLLSSLNPRLLPRNTAASRSPPPAANPGILTTGTISSNSCAACPLSLEPVCNRSGQAVASNLCIALECLGLSPADVSASFCN